MEPIFRTNYAGKAFFNQHLLLLLTGDETALIFKSLPISDLKSGKSRNTVIYI